jgi:hypothetical protein
MGYWHDKYSQKTTLQGTDELLIQDSDNNTTTMDDIKSYIETNSTVIIGHTNSIGALNTTVGSHTDSIAAINSSLSAIGAISTITGDFITVATATDTALCSLVLQPGTYIILGSAYFASNTNGIRRLTIAAEANTTSNSRGMTNVAAAASGTMVIQAVRIESVTDATTYYCNVNQNSGASLTCSGQLRAIRIV